MCIAYGEACDDAVHTGNTVHQDYILAGFLREWFGFYPTTGRTWEERWLAEGKKEQVSQFGTNTPIAIIADEV